MTRSAAAAQEVRQAFATGAILDLAGVDVPAALLVRLPPAHREVPREQHRWMLRG